MLHQFFFKTKKGKKKRGKAEERKENQYVASTDCPLQNTKQALWFWHGAETDFCSSLLNGGVHLYIATKHHQAICVLHPRSFRSISPLQFILYKPLRRGRAKKSDRRSSNCWGHRTAWLTVWPVRSSVCLCVKVPRFTTTPQPLCLCNGGGRGVTICQEVCADGRGLYIGH